MLKLALRPIIPAYERFYAETPRAPRQRTLAANGIDCGAGVRRECCSSHPAGAFMEGEKGARWLFPVMKDESSPVRSGLGATCRVTLSIEWICA